MKRKIKFRSIVIFAVILYMGYLFVSQSITINRINGQITAEKVELQKTKEESSKLQDEVKKSQSLKYSEQLAREILGLVKDGETPVINSQNK